MNFTTIQRINNSCSGAAAAAAEGEGAYRTTSTTTTTTTTTSASSEYSFTSADSRTLHLTTTPITRIEHVPAWYENPNPPIPDPTPSLHPRSFHSSKTNPLLFIAGDDRREDILSNATTTTTTTTAERRHNKYPYSNNSRQHWYTRDQLIEEVQQEFLMQAQQQQHREFLMAQQQQQQQHQQFLEMRLRQQQENQNQQIINGCRKKHQCNQKHQVVVVEHGRHYHQKQREHQKKLKQEQEAALLWCNQKQRRKTAQGIPSAETNSSNEEKQQLQQQQQQQQQGDDQIIEKRKQQYDQYDEHSSGNKNASTVSIVRNNYAAVATKEEGSHIPNPSSTSSRQKQYDGFLIGSSRNDEILHRPTIFGNTFHPPSVGQENPVNNGGKENKWLLTGCPSRKETENMLEKSIGNFVVRRRNGQKADKYPYALTFMYKQNLIVHLLIQKLPNGQYVLGKLNTKEEVHRSISSLVAYYQVRRMEFIAQDNRTTGALTLASTVATTRL